jgi:hypothetical protein
MLEAFHNISPLIVCFFEQNQLSLMEFGKIMRYGASQYDKKLQQAFGENKSFSAGSSAFLSSL